MTHPGETKPKKIPCISDIEYHDPKDGIIYRLPGKPEVASPFRLQLENLQIFLENRLNMEKAMKSKLSDGISPVDKQKIEVISRQIKIGITVSSLLLFTKI